MTDTHSDPFILFASLLANEAPHLNPSELHGVICGLLASGLSAEDPEMQGVLASHADVKHGWSMSAQSLFGKFRDEAHAAFHGDSLEMSILLPDEEQLLSDRVAALAVWCDGFMVGFGTGTAGMKDADLPTPLQEAIADLVAISQVESPEDEDEEGESLFEQVVEHCRVSALLIFTELALMRRRQNGQNTNEPTRH
ncbi:MAG: UPF0149 family protein [Alcanivoracaceae bacterium]|nr:UPF0149 family protein [Alcanivoracaceae bacterium]